MWRFVVCGVPLKWLLLLLFLSALRGSEPFPRGGQDVSFVGCVGWLFRKFLELQDSACPISLTHPV